MVTSLSKRAASSGEKIVLAISLTLHHLPRQPFGGKVHLFGDTVQFNRSIFLHVEGGTMSFTVFQRLVREAKPAAAHAESNFVCADFDDCMMPAVKSMGRSVGAKQRCPGGPKFGADISVHLSETVEKSSSNGSPTLVVLTKLRQWEYSAKPN